MAKRPRIKTHKVFKDNIDNKTVKLLKEIHNCTMSKAWEIYKFRQQMKRV